MRLINTSTRLIDEFFDDSIPPFAILSHTWTGEEVSYEEYCATQYDQLQKRYSSSKAGFDKINRACEQTIRDGYAHIWVDTCCIDKRSSAELSEAINSMFSWYERSQICYAYINDLQDADIHVNSSGTVNVDMTHVRWLTRGWTLQEMLAPRFVDFYTKGWKKFGSRKSLAKAISAVTNIDLQVLTDERSLDRNAHGVARRMSWAAGRKTSRKEDIAYCLLGMFDVNMPLIYGEGAKAFTRLQEEIIKNNDDHSIFAWDCQDPLGKHELLAKSPDEFRDSQDVMMLYGLASANGHNMNNTGLQITLPMRKSKYPGYHLARLALARLVKSEDDAGHDEFFGCLWLHDLHGLGRKDAYYAASPYDERLLFEQFVRDTTIEGPYGPEETRTIMITKSVPRILPAGAPLGIGHIFPKDLHNASSINLQHSKLAYAAVSIAVLGLLHEQEHIVVAFGQVVEGITSTGTTTRVGLFGMRVSDRSTKETCLEIVHESYRQREVAILEGDTTWRLTHRKLSIPLVRDHIVHARLTKAGDADSAHLVEIAVSQKQPHAPLF